jgi:hypothetical protein
MPYFSRPAALRNPPDGAGDSGFYCQRARKALSMWADDQGFVSDI